MPACKHLRECLWVAIFLDQIVTKTVRKVLAAITRGFHFIRRGIIPGLDS